MSQETIVVQETHKSLRLKTNSSSVMLLWDDNISRVVFFKIWLQSRVRGAQGYKDSKGLADHWVTHKEGSRRWLSIWGSSRAVHFSKALVFVLFFCPRVFTVGWLGS